MTRSLLFLCYLWQWHLERKQILKIVDDGIRAGLDAFSDFWRLLVAHEARAALSGEVPLASARVAQAAGADQAAAAAHSRVAAPRQTLAFGGVVQQTLDVLRLSALLTAKSRGDGQTVCQ